MSQVYFTGFQILLLNILNSTKIRERVNAMGFDLSDVWKYTSYSKYQNLQKICIDSVKSDLKDEG